MQVGMDVRVLSVQRQRTGVAQYLLGLLQGHRRSQKQDIELLGYSIESDRVGDLGIAIRVVGERRPIPWQSVLLPLHLARRPVAVWHGPAFSVPRALRIPRVVTIHDLAFLRMPETVNDDTARYLHQVVPPSVRAASAVIVPSSEVKEDLLNWMPMIPADRIRVTPLGGDRLAHFAKSTSPISEPYILHVGTLEPRKNLSLLLEAFARLEHLPHRLVLVGAQGWKNSALAPQIAALKSRVVVPGFVDDATLAQYYQHASLYVSVSRYEGYGLGIIEAAFLGVPVVATPTGVVRDISGTGLSRFDGHMASDLADLVAHVLDRPEYPQLRLPTWTDTWADHVSVYQQVANQSL